MLGCEVDAASWSPDNETLVVVSKDSIQFFNRLFLLLSENSLSGGGKGKDELVTVGWGSRETQFQGSVGKDAREKKAINRRAYDKDNGKCCISWRADAQFIAISYLDSSSRERRVSIFNRDGELMSRLQNEFSLEEEIAVRPLGNYIATTRLDEQGQRSLCFFERNGEFRHEAKLFENGGELVRIEWDCEGSILGIETKRGQFYSMEFWTVSNYDWTMKLRICFKKEIISWHWSSVHSKRVWILSENDILCLNLAFEYNVVDGLAIVVATDRLRITNFTKASIPPPLCHYEVPLKRPIQHLVYQQSGLTVVYDDLSIQTWSNNGHSFEPLDLFQMNWLNDEAKVVTAVTILENNDILLAMAKPGKTEVFLLAKNGEAKSYSEFPCSIMALERRLSRNDLIAILDTGEVLQLPDKSSIFRQMHPISCYEFYQDHIINLSANSLFVDKKEIAKDVISFVIRQDKVLYISASLKFNVLDLKNNYRSLDEGRTVEAGSLLVGCAQEQGTSVVVQMPRGNLETIHPRPFVIDLIKLQIKSKEYLKALKSMKKHRIDMNLLIDYDFEGFLENITIIIESVNDPDLLNLLIASLNDSTSEWVEPAIISVSKKVDRICFAFIEAFLKLPIATRLRLFTVLLSTLLKFSPPKVQEALSLLKENTLQVPSNEREKATRRWLHHIGFFIEAKVLFSTALATYDLSLAAQVAEASSQDPKEFLPLLNRLRKVDPADYQRYHVDLIREEWRSALTHIAKLDEKFDEAVQFVKQKELYSSALVVYQGTKRFKEISALYASFLESKASWRDAAFLYAQAGKTSDQLRCLEKAREPHEFYEIATNEGWSTEEIRMSLRRMSVVLKSSTEWEKLAISLSLMSAPVIDICDAYTKAGLWDEAIRQSSSDEKARLAVRASILDKSTSLSSTSQTKCEELDRHVERLKLIRSIKQNRIMNLKDGVETGRDLEDIDAYSDISTISGISRKTGASRASTTATARRRKTIEKKKRNLKEGGEWEDAAILLAVHSIYATLDDTIEATARILRPLLQSAEVSLAVSLQKSVARFESKCQQLFHIFWPYRISASNLLGPLNHIYTIDNNFQLPDTSGMPPSFVLEPEMIPPKLNTSAWKLQILENTDNGS